MDCFFTCRDAVNNFHPQCVVTDRKSIICISCTSDSAVLKIFQMALNRYSGMSSTKQNYLFRVL